MAASSACICIFWDVALLIALTASVMYIFIQMRQLDTMSDFGFVYAICACDS